MGVPRAPDPVLLLVAVFSRYPEAIDWARQKVVEEWGPLALESPAFPFSHTDYYTPTMGPDLKKVFFCAGGFNRSRSVACHQDSDELLGGRICRTANVSRTPSS
ncbi:MAG: hypothetical protein KatS3mg112_0861 [Thermogutta sp.]|nr:MAG: hypothetical protein KatS3mg112_0861 [Thermogutta sp.]